MRISVSLLNAENLYLFLQGELPVNYLDLNEEEWQSLSHSIYKNKSLKKLKQLALNFEVMNPDLILLTEVGGMESLENFNKYFLQSKYQCILESGNSDRAIDVGFLLRKSIPLRFDLRSNKERKIGYLYSHEEDSLRTGYTEFVPTGESHKFSRDVSELHLFAAESDRAQAVFLLTHLKSKLDPDGIDPDGKERRRAEFETLLQIYNEVDSKYSSQVPIFVCGDFNGNATRNQTDGEFKKLYELTDLEDVLEYAEKSFDERATFYNVRPRLQVHKLQLDYAFLSKKFLSCLNLDSVRVFSFKDLQGLDIPVPLTLDQKNTFPSDHNPVVFEINLPVK
jgi:hypothetical protein